MNTKFIKLLKWIKWKVFLKSINEIAALRLAIHSRIYASPKLEGSVVDNFHKLYFHGFPKGRTWNNTFWQGARILKCPLDLWIYQEIIYKVKPDIIIETGTMYGGSALYLAHLCDLMGKGKVLTIDIRDRRNESPLHERIKYFIGSSTSKEIIESVKGYVGNGDVVMVILDSDHSKDHVLTELKIYNEFVTRGSYLIVEDTNINGHPVYPDYGPGPMEAVEEFLKENKNFIVDKEKEKFYLTFNPKGYLKKV